MQYPAIQKFCADAGYRGVFITDMPQELDLDVDISEKIKPHEWEELPYAYDVRHGWRFPFTKTARGRREPSPRSVI